MGRKYLGGLKASRERRKEKIAQYQKEYYAKHKDERKEYSTKWQRNNKEKYCDYQKKYYAENSVKIQAQRKKHIEEKIISNYLSSIKE